MGYSITITADKEFDINDIQKIVDNLPEEFTNFLGKNLRQLWGWSTGVDIHNPEGNKIVLSGSYGISGKIIEDYLKYFHLELRKLDYKTKVEYHW